MLYPSNYVRPRSRRPVCPECGPCPTGVHASGCPEVGEDPREDQFGPYLSTFTEERDR